MVLHMPAEHVFERQFATLTVMQPCLYETDMSKSHLYCIQYAVYDTHGHPLTRSHLQRFAQRGRPAGRGGRGVSTHGVSPLYDTYLEKPNFQDWWVLGTFRSPASFVNLDQYLGGLRSQQYHFFSNTAVFF